MKQWWDAVETYDFEADAKKGTRQLREAILKAQGYRITLQDFLPQRGRVA